MIEWSGWRVDQQAFRYAARTWELSAMNRSVRTIFGREFTVQVSKISYARLASRKRRVDDEVADRDRFSYEGLNSPGA